MDVHPPHGGAGVRSREHPRSDVRIVVQAGDDHLVARLQRLRERSGHVEQQARRVRTEDDLVGIGSREVRGGSASLSDDGIGLLARRERPMRVAHPAAVVARHRLDHVLRHLGATGGIHEDHRPAVVADAGKGREASADSLNVEHGHRLPHRVALGNRFPDPHAERPWLS